MTVITHNHRWSDLVDPPTTLAAYGITDAASDAELAAHEADTTNIHGIANTAKLPVAIVAARQSGTITGSGFQTLASVTIPGGTLGTAKGVKFEAKYRRTTGSGNATPRIVYGSTTLITFGADTAVTQYVRGTLFGAGATNAQRVHCESSRAAGGSTGTAAEDSTGDLALALQIDLGTDSDVFTLDWLEAFAVQ